MIIQVATRGCPVFVAFFKRTDVLGLGCGVEVSRGRHFSYLTIREKIAANETSLLCEGMGRGSNTDPSRNHQDARDTSVTRKASKEFAHDAQDYKTIKFHESPSMRKTQNVEVAS